MIPELRLYFRNEFRRARAEALADAEAFDEIIVVIEKLGVELAGGPKRGLGDYEEALTQLAKDSPMAQKIPTQLNGWHSTFTELFNAVRIRRNQAIHTGAVARHLTQHAVGLSLILEEAIMNNAPGFRLARDFMVTGPLCAELWQPLSFIRQNMLVNSFSYLPVKITENNQEQWRLIADHALASYLRKQNNTERPCLIQNLRVALESNDLKCEIPAAVVDGEESVANFINKLGSIPVLVTSGGPSNLVGIVTAHDLL